MVVQHGWTILKRAYTSNTTVGTSSGWNPGKVYWVYSSIGVLRLGEIKFQVDGISKI